MYDSGIRWILYLSRFFFFFSWWNPCVWLMKREMAMNLEYLADNGVLREGGSTAANINSIFTIDLS